MSLAVTLDLDESAILEGLFFVLPSDIAALVSNFLYELGDTTSAGLMSTALFFSIYNTSNGFRAIIRISNHAYGIDDRRSFPSQVGLSFVLMLLFSVALLLMLGLLIFGRQIWSFFFPGGTELLFAIASGSGALIILTFIMVIIYKLACATPMPLKHILPGAVFAVVTWVVVSSVFGFAISNFTQYSAVYGSIAGVFILMLWLNTVSIVLLIGNEMNAVSREYYK